MSNCQPHRFSLVERVSLKCVVELHIFGLNSNLDGLNLPVSGWCEGDRLVHSNGAYTWRIHPYIKPHIAEKIYALELCNANFLSLVGRNCSGKNIRFYAELSNRWKQRNDGNWPNEHLWLSLFVLCCYRQSSIQLFLSWLSSCYIYNISKNLLICYTCLGSFSRSAINYNAGAKTAFSNIIMAVAVLVTLLFLMPLFYYTPNLILAAIIVTAVIGLVDCKAAYRMWKLDKLDFLSCFCSFFGVLFISVQMGLAIAVCTLSRVLVLLNCSIWLW